MLGIFSEGLLRHAEEPIVECNKDYILRLQYSIDFIIESAVVGDSFCVAKRHFAD